MDETGSVVLEKKNSKLLLVNVFLLFRNYLPLEEGVTLYLNKLESASPKNALCEVWLKLVQWEKQILKFCHCIIAIF